MKTLVCINSCNRIHFLKSFIWNYLQLHLNNKNFDFLLVLDGKNTNYLNFCENHNIPTVYSSLREGIGIAKNRVLKSFPDYDYYFFLDDDVELLDSSAFEEVIKISNILNIPHLSLGRHERFIEITKKQIINNQEIEYSLFGPGAFSFFTKEGILKVGGFHPEFAKYRRFGHTEHSYRFMNANLQEYPFVNIPSISDKFIWHEPSSVTKVNIQLTKDFIALPEAEIMALKLQYYPIETLSNYEIKNIKATIKNKYWLKITCMFNRKVLSIKYKLQWLIHIF
jgi:hypothetical protein